MKHLCYILNVLLFLMCSCVGNKVEIGKPLPAWKEGELDIHFINTGRGECTWQIMPDGTTFLVDASGSLKAFGVDESDPLPAKPSAGIKASKVIIDYINHFSPTVSKGHVNYFLLTHLHGDHMGDVKDTLPVHRSGQFLLSSLPEIGSGLVFDKIFDRDYPGYTYPIPSLQDSRMMNNYKAFLNWTAKANGTVIEQWKVGSRTQVTPVYNPGCGVTVRAYSGNGRFWTGEGDDESYTLMPTTEEFEAGDPDAIPTENCYSCSYILTYKDFDFFLGGDLQHNDRENYEYKDTETPIAKVAHKVEVMKANHHGTLYTHDPYFISVLCPDVWVVSNWRDVQPRPVTIDNVLEANPDCAIFTTNMPEKNIPVLGKERLDKIVSDYGHVVVRVNPDGKSFMVYTLDDTDQLYNVKSIHGPFMCTK